MSRLTDYGIVLLTHLAEGGPGMQAAPDLAAASHVPLPTVSKLLKELSKAGLVISYRGRKGGYSLARPAEQISLAQIVVALEGPLGLTDCSTISAGICNLESICPARHPWSVISRVIEQALEGVSLSSLRSRATPPSPLELNGVRS